MDPFEYLRNLDALGMIFGLENISRVLERAGHPEKYFRSVHIGGTNGKGSVGAFLTAVFNNAGYKVGLYTSPHLEDLCERIQVGGRLITRDELAELITCLKEIVESEGVQLTYFEFFTVLAFEYFRRQKISLGVVEVGLGGRLDATNTLTPLLSVITNIGMEHQNYLGNTELEIAWEKAGIVKPDSLLVTGVKQPEIKQAYAELCRKLRTKIYLLEKDFNISRKANNTLLYSGIIAAVNGLKLSLTGEHQNDNAALALAAVELLTVKGYQASPEAIRKGLLGAVWPARMEIVGENPLVILDGAHNPDGAMCLAKFIKDEFGDRKIHLVLGILSDKNYHQILKILSQVSTHATLTRPPVDRALPLNTLEEAARQYFPNVQVEADPKAAVTQTISAAAPEDLVLIAGSLYLIGRVRPMFHNYLASRKAAIRS